VIPKLARGREPREEGSREMISKVCPHQIIGALFEALSEALEQEQEALDEMGGGPESGGRNLTNPDSGAAGIVEVMPAKLTACSP